MAGQPISEAARTFGERVRVHRQQLGKSQEQLADDIGLHWTYVGQVERGRRNISLHNILKFADGLGVDPGTLIAGLKPPQD